jgi:hypothetical protein
MREEIKLNIESSRQSLYLTFVATAGLITAAPFIYQAHLEILFLLIPLFFYIISFTQVRAIFFQNNLGYYLKTSVIPNIRGAIDDLAPGKEPRTAKLMEWEEMWPTLYHNNLLKPATAAVYGAPLIVAFLLFVAFFFLVPLQKITIMEWALIVLNIPCLIYSGYLGVWTNLHLQRKL